MSDPIEPDATPEPITAPDPEAETPDPDADALGDKGKQALDRMKVAKKAAEDEAKAATARAVAAEAALAAQNKSAEEVALDAAREEGTRTATEAANLKLAKSALKLAAKGVLADPADALAFIKPEQFEVDENGDVDPDALASAIALLIEAKPHLAASPDNPFKGAGDGGATPPPKPPASLSEQAAAALAAGDVKTSIALKTAQLKPL